MGIEHYTIAQIAEKLNASKWFVRSEIKAGNLKSKFIAGKYIVSTESLLEYLNQNKVN